MSLSFRGKLQKKYERCGNHKEPHSRMQRFSCGSRLVRAHAHTHTQSTQNSIVRWFCFSKILETVAAALATSHIRLKIILHLCLKSPPPPATCWVLSVGHHVIPHPGHSRVSSDPSAILFSIKRGSLQFPNRPWSALPPWHYAYSFGHLLFQYLCPSTMLTLFLKCYSNITPPVKSHHSKHLSYLSARYSFSFLFLENWLPVAWLGTAATPPGT